MHSWAFLWQQGSSGQPQEQGGVSGHPWVQGIFKAFSVHPQGSESAHDIPRWAQTHYFSPHKAPWDKICVSGCGQALKSERAESSLKGQTLTWCHLLAAYSSTKLFCV